MNMNIENSAASQDKIEDEEKMQLEIFANHTFKISQAEKYRFTPTTFGHHLTSDISPFDLQDFRKILHRYMHLETYCDAVDDYSGPILKNNFAQHDGNSGPDLFQALFFPKSLAPRTPMELVVETQMSEKSISSMWFRLVAHYFEWLAGVSELQYLSDTDKLRLAVCQLCKVICYSVVYFNYRNSDSDFLYFGSGYYWDRARSNDPLMDEYCDNLTRSINRILSETRKFGMTKQEFILGKLIILFDCTNLMGISEEGLEFCRSMCNKYRTYLSNYVRFTISELGKENKWSQQKIDKLSIEKMRALLDMPIGVESMSKYDDESLSEMVESNYGGMRGTLQQQIHTESKKIRN